MVLILSKLYRCGHVGVYDKPQNIGGNIVGVTKLHIKFCVVDVGGP